MNRFGMPDLAEKPAHKSMARRHFLRGVGGVTLGLPIFESVLPRNARAATAAPSFLAIISSANGVVQARASEVEAWWPTKVGALTTASMTADQATRASGELAAYASKLLFVKGLQHSLGANGCNHASACSQLLTGAAALSGRTRLDQHLTAIRELEIKVSNSVLPDSVVAQITSVDPKPYDTNNHELIQQLHMDLIVFAISSGYTRVAVLQVGDREDDHEYVLNGVKTQFHTASHRTLPNSYELCKQIDRIQIKHFKYSLDKLSMTTTPTGTFFDQGITVNTNQLGTGPDHSMKNLPYIIAGTGNGYLTTGKFLDAGGVSNSLMLNTLAQAVGVKTSMGGRAGTVSQMLA